MEAPWRELRLRALVLAAGLGTRLRPLTERAPKPLLPVLGQPILAHTLHRLAAIGCEATAINLHYLGAQIRDRLGSSFEGMPLTYSEEPQALGTLGAFPPLREFFAPADLILLINGDSLCRWPLARLLTRHLHGDALATLLLASRPSPATFGGGVAIERKGAILAFRRNDPVSRPVARRHVFAGAHVFAPSLLSAIEEGVSDIVRDLYVPSIAHGGLLQAVVTDEPWHDLGTPRRYLEAVLDWARIGGRSKRGLLYSGPDARFGAGSELNETVLEAGAEVGDGCKLKRVLALPGARIGAGSRLCEVVVGPDVELPPSSDLEGCVVVAENGGASASGWVVAPLDPG